jgi:FKBP-type peptidyl-prolyl cis-trans isomerase SlyD
MNEAKPTIAENMVVTVDYTLTLDNGEIADSTSDGMPLRFLAGSGELLPAFEDALMGMAAGDELELTLSPEEGYGEYDEEAFEEVGIENFPSREGLEPGMAIEIRESDGETYPAYISEVRDSAVVLDYNHPLAGETLHFHIAVLDVRPATEEELTHGHSHAGDGHVH